MKLITLSRWALVLAFTLAGAPIVRAEEDAEGSQDAPSTEHAGRMGGDLAQQARNPTSSLTMLSFVVDQTPSFHNLESADETRIVVMPVIPFTTGNLQHIARVTVPYVAAGPDWGLLTGGDTGNVNPPNYVPTKDKTGLSDTALFDFLIFGAPWEGGKLAAGISAILPTATDPALGTEKWSAGPAVAGLVQKGKLLAGLIVLSNFSFAGKSHRDDVRTMAIQPFGSYGLGSGWSAELSEMVASYNFENSKWGSVPLGGRVGKMVTFGSLPVRFYADAEYNFADKAVARKWTFRFAVVPLI